MTGARHRLPASPFLTAAMLIVALAAISLFAQPGPVRANGVPTLVQLSYLDGLSNWGPTDAGGTVELSFAEGFVRLSADGLPAVERERYQGWIVNSQTNDAISIGQFDASPDGEVRYEGALPPIAEFGFDLFILTVEPEPDDAPQPSPHRSIGGRFSLIGLPAADGTMAADTQGGATGAAPQQLPNTGDPTLVTDLLRVAVLAGVLALSIVVAVRLARRPA